MRYINKKDERVKVQEETCTCGHSAEEHQGPDGGCQGTDEESGERCECMSYEREEEGAGLAL